MGNKLCACDEKAAETSTTPLSSIKPAVKASDKALKENDSMSKLMLNNQAKVPEQDKDLKQTEAKESRAPSTEEKEEESQSYHFEKKESQT